MKKIKKIRSNVSNNNESYIISISISDSDSSLSSYSEWDEIRQTSGRNSMKKLDQIVTNNIKNKNQCDDAI